MDNTQNQTVYIESRPATGGDEAKIWASDLLRMYFKFAIHKGWKVTQIADNVLKITGDNVVDLLKNETGVHRVQRIPETEKRGRIHTSTATIAVIPHIQESQIQINPADLEWQFFRASTQGGQNVQKVSTAVRLIHKPTGITVVSQQERTQEQNRKIALELLRAKLFQMQKSKKEAEIQSFRQAIGSGKRAEKIRTYNFPQNRVTDHRIAKSWNNLEDILNGKLDKIVEALTQIKNTF